MGLKRVPNRIFDVETFRKPLESVLNGSWSHLESSWTLLEASWSLLDTILGAQEPSGIKSNGPLAAGNLVPGGGLGGDALEESTASQKWSHSLQHPDKQG